MCDHSCVLMQVFFFFFFCAQFFHCYSPLELISELIFMDSANEFPHFPPEKQAFWYVNFRKHVNTMTEILNCFYLNDVSEIGLCLRP
jgi:hypothetical protein